jgi:tetratricopeptide (TPR) repeat protein
MTTNAHQNGSVTQQTSRTKADELRKSGHFEKAVEEYALVWPDGDVWTGWGYAHCLRKVGRCKEALEVAKAVHSLDPDFRFGRSIYAWTLYDIHVRKATDPESDVLRAANTIVQLTNDEQAYSPTSALAITVLHVAKLWARKGRDLRVLEWLERLDLNRLPLDPGKGADEKGRPRELASRKEQYYSLLTRSLERLGRWQECLDTATRALSECGRLHHDNEIWFARRIALAKQRLGKPQEAVTELQHLLERKPVAFLHTDIASAAWDASDYDCAFKHALHALLAPQDVGFKLEAARLMAEILWKREEKEQARNHIRLCLAVRDARGWKLTEDLTKLQSTWEVNGPLGRPESLLGELRPLWERWREDLSPRIAGVITKMLPNGNAGFIHGEDKRDFYFDTRDWREHKSKLREGIRVTFATKPSFDRKHQRPTVVACDVRVQSDRVNRVRG